MIFVLLLTFAISITSHAQITSSEIDSLVEEAMKKFNVAGVAVGIVKDGAIIHNKGYGIKSIETKEAVNEHTIFAIASNSKAFTTAALAILVEEGKISAYLRVLKAGVSYKNPSLGRVLVSHEARGRGLARKIVCAGIDYIINNWDEEKITIGAQDYLRDFYESLGFEAVSEVYSEDGIPHVDMTYNKK